MKTRYEMVDNGGRRMVGVWDEDEQVLKVTMHLMPKNGVPIVDTLIAAGFTILSEEEIEKPKILPFKRKD